jgi:hypothetical protein
MPLLEIKQIRHIDAAVRPDESTAAQVDQHAAFTRASADDVVDKVLNYVFSKDRDFQEFLKTPQAKQGASALRVRKSPGNGAAEQLPTEPASGVETTSSARVMKRDPALNFVPEQEPGFALEQFCTPTLEGSCRSTASRPPR